MKKFLINNLLLIVLAQLGLTTGCKKWVEVNAPPTSLSSGNVYTDDKDAIAAVTNMYLPFANGGLNFSLPGDYALFGSLSADDLTLDPSFYNNFNNNITPCYKNSQNVTAGLIIDLWSSVYPMIYKANAAIDGLNASSGVTPAVKQQLLGEAKFMRAYLYFLMVNYYGSVPLVTSSDYTQNITIPRADPQTVYRQMIRDLSDTEQLLSSKYIDGTLLAPSSERTRPIKWAAAALLARVYLYNGNLTGETSNYTHAVKQADSVINNSALYGLTSLDNAFLKNSNEAIWQVQPINYGINSFEAVMFQIPATGISVQNPLYLNQALVNDFEPGDQRLTHWINKVTLNGATYNMAYKFKKGYDASVTSFNALTEYEMMLRLGEVYLIRAEAKNDLNDATAVNDLNAIRTRAGLPNYSGAISQAAIAQAILHERRVELFTEGAHRWFDLKRTKTIDAVMGGTNGSNGACAAKGGTWGSYKQLYPIPTEAIKGNSINQNPGY